MISPPRPGLWHRADPVESGAAAVLFVHGMTGTADIWRPQLDAFRRAGFRTVVVDRRGAGRSPAIGPGVVDRAADLAGVLDALDLDRAHVVGHAAGGADALALTLSHPERVSGLVLTNTQAGYAAESFRAELDRAWTPALMALPAETRELAAGYRDRDPAGWAAWQEIHARADHGARVVETSATPADLAGIRTPVLLVAGDLDPLTPPAVMSLIADAMPTARMAVVAGTAHVSSWERPEAWNTVVLGFLATVP